MKKALAKKSGSKGREIEPRHNEKVDFSKFEPDLSDKDLMALYGIPFPPPFFIAIETLSPAKTVGLGETNLTIIMSTIVQLDAATPYASFDLTQTPSRNPTIQMHFYPAAYGITGTGNYIMEFRIESFGQNQLQPHGVCGHWLSAKWRGESRERKEDPYSGATKRVRIPADLLLPRTNRRLGLELVFQSSALSAFRFRTLKQMR
jgi:hypothetical protein